LEVLVNVKIAALKEDISLWRGVPDWIDKK